LACTVSSQTSRTSLQVFCAFHSYLRRLLFEPSFSIAPIFFEFILFVLTMIKFYHAVREGWGREQVLTRFLEDGIWAFALPFGMYYSYLLNLPLE
jgi:hypothetical protein